MTTSVNNDTNQSMLDSLGLSRKATTKSAGDMGADQFMQLMLAQLKNQDPTNPTDSSQYLTQIAQFSTVTGIQDLNTSFSSLSSALQSNQALQASSLVGRTVLVPTNKGALGASGGVTGTANLGASTTNVAVGVYSAAGQLVRTLNLGQRTAGDVPFAWDGMDESGAAVAAGTYTFKATAFINGKSTALDTNIYSQVQSVDLGGSQGIQLNLAGAGSINLSTVKQIL